MKVFQVISSGFGKQLYLAETVEQAIDEFKTWVAHVDKLNGYESGPTDTVIQQVRRIGLVINHKT